MAIKELKTRIALKYDSYANWTDPNSAAGKGKNLVLLAGELGICAIENPNTDTKVAPTILFKVGDGTSTFEELPWASAKAADVYQWAKASEVKREGKSLVFVGGGDKGGNVTVTFDYVTLSEVQAITNALDTRVTNVEDSLADSGKIGAAIKSAAGRLDAIEGANGTIATTAASTLASAKTYADGKASDAQTAAKNYTDAEITKVDGKITEINTKNNAQDTAIAANTTAIEQEVADRGAAISGVTTAFQNADTAINEKIGGSYSKTATVHAAIVDAKKAGTDAAAAAEAAQDAIDALTTGAVAQNTTDIASLNTALENEAKARSDKDGELEGRLEDVEAFFKLESGETLDSALDTLKEIQDYLNGEGTATDGIIGRVAAAENAIDDLEAEFETNGRVSKAETAITALSDVTDGYTAKGSIKTAVDAAKKQADKGVADAATAQAAAEAAQNAADAAQGAADKAQGEVDALEGVVENVSKVANKATTDIAALDTRVGNAETAITNLQTLTSGADGNANLRKDITALQTLTGGANGNAKLREDLTALSNTVTDSATGLAATKAIADEANARSKTNATNIQAIADDYVKATDLVNDEYIFNCGSSSLIIHKAN